MKLKIQGRKFGITFSSAHFLPFHKKCSKIHGHSYAINMHIDGEKNEHYMILDFTTIKKEMKKIAEKLDHKILIPKNSNSLKIIEKENDLEIISELKHYTFPKEDTLCLNINSTTTEEILDFISHDLLNSGIFSKNIKKIKIGLEEEDGQSVWKKILLN